MRPQSSRAQPAATRAGLAAAALCTVALAACSGAATEPVPPSDGPAPALVGVQAGRMLRDHDRRHDAVVARLAKSYDPAVWDAVASGPALARNRFASALADASGRPPAPTSTTNTAELVFVPTFDGGPRWVVTAGTTASAPATSPTTPAGSATPQPTATPARPEATATSSTTAPAAGAENTVVVWEQAGADAPWKQWSSTVLDDAAAPATSPAPGEATPTAADTDAGVAIATSLAGYLGRGVAPPFAVTPRMAELRRGLTATPASVASISTACVPFAGAAAPERSVRVVRTTKGTLTVGALRCTSTITAKEARGLAWNAAYAKALGVGTERTPTLEQVNVVTFAVERRGDAQPVPLGLSMGVVRADDGPD